MRNALRYHPIETEAILHLLQTGHQWKVIARRIGRDVDGSSLRQHVRRVAPWALRDGFARGERQGTK